MSRRKDRERFLESKRLNPEYRGFRGHGVDSSGADDSPLEMVTCSVCGRRRNIAPGVAKEAGDSYVCLSCQEEAERQAAAEGAAG